MEEKMRWKGVLQTRPSDLRGKNFRAALLYKSLPEAAQNSAPERKDSISALGLAQKIRSPAAQRFPWELELWGAGSERIRNSLGT